MAKRFTDTDKWKKSFVKGLPVEYKIFWLYLLDDCNHAGIWHVEFDLVQLRLGVSLSEKKALGLFNADNCARVVVFDNGNKWFLPDFIEFQYGELGEKNRAHKSVFDLLSRHDLIKFLSKNKPLTSPLQGAKDKEQDKDKDKEYLIPSLLKIWQAKNPNYPKDDHRDFEPLRKIAEFIAGQNNLSIENQNHYPAISEKFEKVCGVLASDKFWNGKPLISIEGRIQEFYSKAIQSTTLKRFSGIV